MKRTFLIVASFVFALTASAAETAQQKGKRLVDEAVAALGGEKYRQLQDHTEYGRAYSFYRERLSGLSLTRFYTRYLSNVKDTAHTLASEVREYYGKKEETSVLLTEAGGFEIGYKGAHPLPADRFARYKESAIRDILYILRIRLNEPGMLFEAKGADVLANRPVEKVDIYDAENRLTTVYFDQTTKLPIRQIILRRDPVTKEKIDEVTEYSNYKSLTGVLWPMDIHRERNGEKNFELFAEKAQANTNPPDDRFQLPPGIQILKPAI